MHVRLRVTLAAALLAPVAVLAPTPPPVAAAPTPPVLSVSSGAPGTRVEVLVPDCVLDEDADVVRFTKVLMFSGVGPDEVLIGIGSGFEDPAVLVVPDWVDPAQPASIEVTCSELSGLFDDAGELVETVYDPVAFDVLDGVDPPAQTASLSRTSLLAGQAFQVDGAGCNLPDAIYGGASVFPGTAQNRRTFDDEIGAGDGEVVGGSFQGMVAMANGTIAIGEGFFGGDPGDRSIEEIPTDLAPGPYTVLPFCSDTTGATLLYEPLAIEVTGAAPVHDVELTVDADSRVATLAGGSCDVGPVMVGLESVDFDVESWDASGERSSTVTSRAGLGVAPGGSPFATPGRPNGSGRSFPGSSPGREATVRGLEDDGYLEAELAPSPGGDWSITDRVSLDDGIVFGYSFCGDPLADGWLYDPQAASIEVALPVPPVPPTTPPAAAPPLPAPAVAVPGTPTYAG